MASGISGQFLDLKERTLEGSKSKELEVTFILLTWDLSG